MKKGRCTRVRVAIHDEVFEALSEDLAKVTPRNRGMVTAIYAEKWAQFRRMIARGAAKELGAPAPRQSEIQQLSGFARAIEEAGDFDIGSGSS